MDEVICHIVKSRRNESVYCIALMLLSSLVVFAPWHGNFEPLKITGFFIVVIALRHVVFLYRVKKDFYGNCEHEVKEIVRYIKQRGRR